MSDRRPLRRGEPAPDPRETPPALRPGVHAIATGTAELVPDGDGRGGWTLLVNGIPCSHVDPNDPLRLDFEYMRWIADLLDVIAPPGEPLHTLHLGGAACTLARYLAATRPASRQLVVELDPMLVDLVRAAFGLRSTSSIRLRVGEAREVLAGLASARYAVVVRDAFEVDAVPEQLTTLGFVREVARVLLPGGTYVANIGDGGAMEHSRQETATALAVFRHVAVVAEPGQFHGRRFGNVVIVASDRPLPLSPFGRRLASGPFRTTLLEDDEVAAFAAGRRPIEDPPSG